MKYVHLLLAISFLPLFAQEQDPQPVVSDNDLLMTAQPFKAAKRNKSVMGKPLSIHNKIYKEGIGTHAVSMMPISVPSAQAILSGACGLDDGAPNKGKVKFYIMSGSEILWSSSELTQGMPAEEFSVKAPQGAKKLYLFVDDLGNADDDHADWVDLKWTANPEKKVSMKAKNFKASDFGIKSDVEEDQGPAFRKAISALRAHPGSSLDLPKGTYHFYKAGTLPMSYHISNHDQPAVQPTSIPLNDMDGVTINGNGSMLMFHGYIQPISMIDSKNVKLNNLRIDYARSGSSELVLTKVGDDFVEGTLDPKHYPYEIKDGKLTFLGEDGWRRGPGSVIAFQKDTHHIIEKTADMAGPAQEGAEDLGDNKVRLKWKVKGKLNEGDIANIRCWGWERPHPAVLIYRSNKSVLKDVSIHNSKGMGVLAQRSEDITLSGGGVYPNEDIGRVHSTEADATHYSNTKGHILSENGLYDGMMDDAINVHSTCLSVQEIKAPNQLLCKYMHGQSVGFETFLPGETLRFIAGPTLELKDEVKVKSVEKLSTTEILITLSKDIPSYVKVGDAVENADYQPSVTFKGNTVRNNRARGALFTTPKKVIVEKNNFDHSSGSAILLAGDAQGWYESGACEDVIIRDNIFTNNLTSMYQFTNAIISGCPEVRKIADQKERYHRDVIIENNVFNTFQVPLLYSISTKNLKFVNNIINYNNDFQAWNDKPFRFNSCEEILIKGNKITPAKEFSIEDVTLENTPESEVKFK